MRLATLGLLFLLTSCGGEKEDPSLVGKYEKQKKEIAALEEELSTVRNKIAEIEIPDPTSDLSNLKAEISKATDDRKGLDSEIKELEKQKVEAIKNLAEYKEKYPIRPR